MTLTKLISLFIAAVKTSLLKTCSNEVVISKLAYLQKGKNNAEEASTLLARRLTIRLQCQCLAQKTLATGEHEWSQ